MFSQGGLSLEQAPPISVILRFFVTGAIFGVLLSIFLIFDRYISYPIIVHLLELGVMVSFMLGAMFQMLPVLAGVVIQTPIKRASVANTLLIVGILFQVGAFALGIPILYLISATLLGGGLLHASTFMLKELFKVQTNSSSSLGMLFALICFTVTILLGVTMLLMLGGYIDSSLFSKLKEIHYSFGLFGWITLLIIAISFQVVEMFFVTPKYPTLITKHLIALIFSLLVLKSILIFIEIDIGFINMALGVLFLIYSLVSIYQLYNRKRPTSDASVWFWRLGMGFLTLIGLGLISISHEFIEFGYIAFAGFGLSIVFAMIYKIVPFLVWFHLSNEGYMEAPMMHDVIHPKKAKIHFYIHLLSFLLLIIDSAVGLYTPLIGTLFLISFGWLLSNLMFAINKYKYTKKNFEPIKW